jgi:hypothetical protein
MQCCAPGAIAQVHELRFGVQELLHAPCIARGRRHVDWVISFGRLDSAATSASLFKQSGHVFVTSIPRNGEQRFAVVCTCVK